MSNKRNMMKIGITAIIALMFCVSVCVAVPMRTGGFGGTVPSGHDVDQEGAVADQEDAVAEEVEVCPCELRPYDPTIPSDPKEMLCPAVAEAAPYIYHSIEYGYYEGKDISPLILLLRINALVEWCADGQTPSWSSEDGYGFDLLTALAKCVLIAVGLAGVVYLVASFIAVNILLGISAYGIATIVMLEFGVDHTNLIVNAFEACVDVFVP